MHAHAQEIKKASETREKENGDLAALSGDFYYFIFENCIIFLRPKRN